MPIATQVLIVSTPANPVVSDFARKYVAEGKAAGLVESLLMLLDEGKGFEIPEALRARIRDCQDPETLRAWYKQALHAQALSDVFEADVLEQHGD